MEITEYIQAFFSNIENSSIEIYNEFSLQHELGIFLRSKITKPYKVEFERNISFFVQGAKCVKSEMDIVIYHPDRNDKYAIELKFPKNGQYPESMFSFIKDIKFMEQAKQLGFTNTYAVDYCGVKAPVLRTLAPLDADNSPMSAEAAPLFYINLQFNSYT